MNLFVGLIVGLALGLAYFGGLWLTTRRLSTNQAPAGLAVLRRSGRLALVAGGLVVLSQLGLGPLLAGLAGMWLSRGFLIARLGGPDHDS